MPPLPGKDMENMTREQEALEVAKNFLRRLAVSHCDVGHDVVALDILNKIKNILEGDCYAEK